VGLDEPGVEHWREPYVQALLALGRFEEADVLLVEFERAALDRERLSSLAAASRLRARLHVARGEEDEARCAFEYALSRLDGLGRPFDQACTEEAYGGFLRRRGDRGAAATRLEAARAAFARLDARPFRLRADRELAACGLRPARRSEARHARLTPQELAVAARVASGMTNKEVAAELVVSVKTVEYHLGHVFSKLGVRSRTELARRFPGPD
jgi:DNA-binding CsgD family transcriptional regulator